jgi:dipeptidyl aminopeptidase/acylaminoacyl peptidase
LAVPGRIRLRDVTAHGQLLVEQGIARRGMVVSSNYGASERDLSWLDFGYLRALSHDGKIILFEEEGSETQTYKVFVRGVDGSPAVPIGEGSGIALSPDKNWVLAEKLIEPVHEIWLLPVGPGEPRRITPPNLAPAIAANFLSDGKQIVYVAREADRPLRTWIQDVNGGNPRPITPEGTAGWLVSPDDKWLLVGHRRAAIGVIDATMVSLRGGSEQKIQGLNPRETILGWTSDGQLYVGSAPGTPHPRTNGTAEIVGLPGARSAVHIAKLNPHTGARTAWRDLAMPPIGGVLPDPPIITPDGASYAFDYRLRLSDLYTVSGVR